MARLESDGIILEIRFDRFEESLEEEWIGYNVRFYWKDDIIVNDNILKRGKWWDKRCYGTFIGNDYEKDYLIGVIKKVLETNKPEYWEPVEPDIIIAIYPSFNGIFFPFIKSHWILVEDDDQKYIDMSKDVDNNVDNIDIDNIDTDNIDTDNIDTDNIDTDNIDKNSSNNPNDLFTIITFVDSYNFKGSVAYSGEGISLHIIVTRKTLEKFVTDLEIEYGDFIRTING